MRHSPQEIFNTAARWLEATGSTPYEARVVADHLTNANLRGHDSHGVGMIAMGAKMMAGTPSRAMMLAIVKVLPDPVTPRSV